MKLFSRAILILSVLSLTFASAQQKPAASGSGSGDRAAQAKSQASAKTQSTIREALSAAPPAIAKTATVKDWQGNVLKQGDGAYTCFPTPPAMKGIGPMCLDKAWLDWREAWMNKKQDFKADGVGIAYMLQGDTGVSNTDPYATQKTADNDWVVSGPHTMVLVPDTSALDAIPTDHHNGGPFVMWKGTPYVHIMVPMGNKASSAGGGAVAMKPASAKSQ